LGYKERRWLIVRAGEGREREGRERKEGEEGREGDGEGSV